MTRMCGARLSVLALISFALMAVFPAQSRADNITAKAADGSLVTLCAKFNTGITYPCHLEYGLNGSGVPTPLSVDNSGNLNVNVVAGGAGGGGTVGATASSSDPTYTAGTQNLSLDLSGYLRSIVKGSVSLTGALPSFGSTQTFNIGTMPNVTLTGSLPAFAATPAVKPVDSTGADASDTTNHAWKVNCVTGCSGSGGSSQPYQPDSYTPATLAVTTTSSRVAAPGTGAGLIVTNTGSTPVFVNVGGSTVTATTTNLIINPGNFFGVYYPGGSAYVAAVTASGSGSLSVVSGTGMPNVGTNTDQTASIAVSGTVGLAGGAVVAGPETQGAAVAGGLVRSGCRAATTTPTAVADGQAVDPMCSLTGKSVTVLYAPSSFAQRGAANTAATTAQALTSWVTPGAGQFAYVTRMECGREDTGTTNIHITMNDTASSTITLPAGSGNNPVFDPPLKVTASATAPTFTLSAAVSGGNVYCSAQGYNE